MAIAFARMEFIKRSKGKNAVCKAAYIERCTLEFEGTKFQPPEVYSWSKLEKPLFSNIYLPNHVDHSFKDPKTLWNAVEKFEKRKDSQVGLEIVLALPDDKAISLEDKICLIERFINTHIMSKGYGVHAVIHPPDKKHGRFSETSGELEKLDHNWHCHLFITSRTFDETGKTFSSIKINDLVPSLRGATHFASNGIQWGKVWAHIQNDFFEEKGLNLRVDFEGVIPQDHLGPVRMRGREAYASLEKQDQKKLMNEELSKNPLRVLERLTSTRSVFSVEDVENYFRKHLPEKELPDIRQAFWNCKEIVELHHKEETTKASSEIPKKFSTVTVIEEEKKIMRLADRIQSRSALKYDASAPLERFKQGLNHEQKMAFDFAISKSSLSCIEGHAGTGKSHLLVALKNLYESSGYTVRAFGPDNATVRVLEEKGFKNVFNIHKFLFTNHFSKNDIISKKEIWFVDESGKLGNGPLLELLKQAEKKSVQIIFVGNSAQLTSVERGGMFKTFCDAYGCKFLKNVQRQKSEHHRQISQHLANGNSSEAINGIAASGGFKWAEDKETAIINLVEKWVKDRLHHPYASQLIIAHSNTEVHHLNEIVHCYRKAWGELSSKEYTCQTSRGKITVSEGDLIEFRENNSELKITNGLIGILISASDEKFVLKIQGEEKPREVTFDPRKFTAYQLGYATTYYRAQGRTVDRAYVLYSKNINKPLFYVGLTRHVNNVHCFVSLEDAKSISDIKLQAKREAIKETSLRYTTISEIEQHKRSKAEEARIEALSKSDQVIDRVKGSYFKAWGAIKTHVSGFVEKIQDRRDSKRFYNPDLSDNPYIQGSAVAISQKEPNRIELTLASQTVEHASHRLPSDPSSFQEKIPNKPPKAIPENQKKIIQSYFERVDQASTLFSIVKSEIAGSNAQEKSAPSFEKWQIACGERNMEAKELVRSISLSDLKEVFSKTSLEILMDRAERHERVLVPKTNLIEQLKGNLEPLLQHLFPEGPTGRDSKGLRFGTNGSFSVVCKGDKLGCFFDFVNKTGGDIIKLIQTQLCLNESDTKEWAHKFLNSPSTSYVSKQYSIATFNKSESQEWNSLIPPQNMPVPSLREISKHLDSQYTLVAQHPYHDSQGNVIQYTLRLQEKGNPSKKIVLPLSFGRYHQSSHEPKWCLKRFQFEKGKNPIYNFHLFKENPGKPVIIVEGEKTADAGVALFDHAVTISWLGGSSATKQVDWSALSGRDVIIWPDNDTAGFKAASDISESLREVGVKSLHVVDPNMLFKEFPQKWDIADPLPEGKTIQFLKDCLQRADSKAVSIDRLSAVLEREGRNGEDPIELSRLNEILWRIDERMRPELEKNDKLKPWDIDNRLISEVSAVINGRDDLLKIASNLSGHKTSVESIAFQGLLHHAKTGKSPSLEDLNEIKNALVSCTSAVNKPSQIDEKVYSHALDKTCTVMIENRLQDKAKINECFHRHVAEIAINQKIEKAANDKTMSTKREIYISSI